MSKIVKVDANSSGFVMDSNSPSYINNRFSSYHLCVDHFHEEVGILLSSGDIAYFNLENVSF